MKAFNLMPDKITKLSLFILLLFFLNSCGQNKGQSNTNVNALEKTDTSSSVSSKLKLSPGDLIQRVNCIEGQNLSFAVYIPQGFVENVKMPVMFLFDPHADGTLPLNLYKSLADKYGYILIGSNDSKNGNSQELTGEILSAIVHSGLSLLPVDTQRIYAGGFSGGARVASMLAFSPFKITGLITCGAGFPKDAWIKTPPSCIVGIAGDGDMNLTELSSLRIDNPELKNRFQLIRFDGKHEWPPLGIFEQAFLALQSTGMRDGMIPKQAEKIKDIDNTYRSFADSLSVSGKLLYEAGLYDRWISSMNGLNDETVPKNTYKDLLKQSSYRQALSDEQQLFADQAQRREVFMNAIGKQDTLWWHQHMNALFAEMKTSAEAKKNMLSRIEGTLSLGTYMNLNSAIKSNQKAAMDYFADLYRTIDPENTESWYLSAEVAAKKSDYANVYNYLSRAVSLGFKDAARVHSDEAFSMMMSDPEFNQIVNRISN